MRPFPIQLSGLALTLTSALALGQAAPTPAPIPAAPPEAQQILPGHLGVGFGLPGLSPPLLPISIPQGFEALEGLGAAGSLRGGVPISLRVRASEPLALRFSLAGLRQSAGAAPPFLALRLEGAAEWHLITTGPFSPFVGALVAGTVFGASGAQATTLELGGSLGLEYFFTPRIAVAAEVRALVQAPSEGLGASFGTTSGGGTLNLYF